MKYKQEMIFRSKNEGQSKRKMEKESGEKRILRKGFETENINDTLNINKVKLDS